MHVNGTFKLFFLIVGIPLLLWHVTFSKTLSLYLEYRDLSEVNLNQAEQFKTAEYEGEILLVGDYVMDRIIMLGKDVRINTYMPSLEKSEGGLDLYKARVQVQGRFVDLLKLVYVFENHSGVALSDVRFFRENDSKRTVMLEMNLIQLVSNGQEENLF